MKYVKITSRRIWSGVITRNSTKSVRGARFQASLNGGSILVKTFSPCNLSWSHIRFTYTELSDAYFTVCYPGCPITHSARGDPPEAAPALPRLTEFPGIGTNKQTSCRSNDPFLKWICLSRTKLINQSLTCYIMFHLGIWILQVPYKSPNFSEPVWL